MAFVLALLLLGTVQSKLPTDADIARQVVRNTVAELTVASSTDWETAQSTIRSALNRFVYERTKRRPVVIPVIMEL